MVKKKRLSKHAKAVKKALEESKELEVAQAEPTKTVDPTLHIPATSARTAVAHKARPSKKRA